MYHDGTGIGHGWNVEYVNIVDNATGHNYCFPINEWISNGERVLVDSYVRDQPCDDVVNHRLVARADDDAKCRRKRSFTVRVKTGMNLDIYHASANWNKLLFEGSEIEAGSTAPLYIRLLDDQMHKSDKIRLKEKDKDGHHFKPGSIDEFQITTDKPPGNLSGIEVSHSADKYQGWFVKSNH